jgi:hypothetical protein
VGIEVVVPIRHVALDGEDRLAVSVLEADGVVLAPLLDIEAAEVVPAREEAAAGERVQNRSRVPPRDEDALAATGQGRSASAPVTKEGCNHPRFPMGRGDEAADVPKESLSSPLRHERAQQAGISCFSEGQLRAASQEEPQVWLCTWVAA